MKRRTINKWRHRLARTARLAMKRNYNWLERIISQSGLPKINVALHGRPGSRRFKMNWNAAMEPQNELAQ